MTPPRVPVPDPVTFDLGNGIKLTTFNNPQTQKHPEEFFMKDLPNCLILKEKYSANDKISCHFCREKVKLSQMRNHVGCHKLCTHHGIENKKIEKSLESKNKQQTPAEDDPEQLGANPCGFCGPDGYFTNLLEKKSGNSRSITVHQIALTTMKGCNTNKQPPFLTICHAQMCQSTVLSTPHLSQEIHKPFGNIIHCII